MLIEVKNLHKSFGENQVLRGIDVSIQKGEVVVVIAAWVWCSSGSICSPI